ncbi:hypothetical protein BDR26DRAFT_953449 [Obelidium mucronatum]|nr:hypothetical protein BDR26DRAFT_953449 [Obelidium mucronatum]
MTEQRLSPFPSLVHPVHAILDNPMPSPGHQQEPTTPVFPPDQSEWLTRNNRIAFTLNNVLSPTECDNLIVAAELIGFEKALLNVGNGRQVLAEDQPLLTMDQGQSTTTTSSTEKERQPLRAVGLNERLRFLKYVPGDRFLSHRDGTFHRGSERSMLTVQFYLNTCEEGGETTMWSDDGNLVSRVRCGAGKALVFSHRIMHEGTAVAEGVKYVIRTDVMYSSN